MVSKKIWRFLLPLLAVLLISGCRFFFDSGLSVRLHSDLSLFDRSGEEKSFSQSEMLLPLNLKEQQFHSVAGWLDDEEIIYVENSADGIGSSVYAYHIFSGKKKSLFRSENPILTVTISPSHSRLLVISSASDDQAKVDVIDVKSLAALYSKTFFATELSAVWNPYDENEILITSFYEDWTYESELLHIDQKRTVLVDLPQPFSVPLGGGEWLMLDWDTETPATAAPLIVWREGKEKRIFDGREFYHVNGWKDVFVAVGVKGDGRDVSDFTFFDRNFHAIGSFAVPLLSGYSEWIVPYYDLLENRRQLLIVEPKSAGVQDSYKGGFRLVLRDIREGKEETVADPAENLPVDCSPNGRYCLYGYRLENILFLKEKKILPLVVTDNI